MQVAGRRLAEVRLRGPLLEGYEESCYLIVAGIVEISDLASFCFELLSRAKRGRTF